MNILFLQTGGTIDKDYPKSTKGYAFEIHEPAVKRILQKLNPSFSFKIQTVLKKDSLEINEIDRDIILKTCNNAKEDKIIITHGTDTIGETAEFLSSIKNKTIILTGSMRPQRFSNSDADLNIGIAIGGIQAISKGIYVALHGLIIPYNQLSRNMETGQYYKKTT
ncbi:asparaginase domain-containing protein [Flavobacteriales bacterium]|nr:asparaginase domain-containing protein [Flavobacteriales bacterium]